MERSVLMITFKNFKNDLNGGIVAGIIALPLAIAFGVSSFSSLGPDYVSTGAVAGLYGAIFTGLFAALFGGTPSQVTGPTGPMAVVSTAAIVTLMQNPSLQAAFPTTAEKIPVILFLFGFTVILGGMTEIFLGIVHAGKIVKYIPYSVIAGFEWNSCNNFFWTNKTLFRVFIRYFMERFVYKIRFGELIYSDNRYSYNTWNFIYS